MHRCQRFAGENIAEKHKTKITRVSKPPKGIFYITLFGKNFLALNASKLRKKW